MKESNPKEIDDLIFKELIRRGYTEENGKKTWNIADSKLWYLRPTQSQAYLDLEQSKVYHEDVIKKEVDLINQEIKSITEKVQGENMNLVDLGCGDGSKAKLFIEKLKGSAKLRYCPVDISNYMVDKALTNVRSDYIDEIVKLQWNISDFENIQNVSYLLRYGGYKTNFYLLLGNTLGNFEIHELLYEIRRAMTEGDFLLIGNGLDNRDPDEILRSYSTFEVHEFLKHIPTQLGINEDDIDFETRFENSRVEMYYTFKKDVTIKFQEKEVVFERGDELLVSVSYKYTKQDFIGFLKMYFNNVECITTKDESYSLALCRR